MLPPSPPKGDSKKIFCFLTKFNFNRKITVLQHASRGLSAIAELLVLILNREVIFVCMYIVHCIVIMQHRLKPVCYANIIISHILNYIQSLYVTRSFEF